jgi:hypothetical protein
MRQPRVTDLCINLELLIHPDPCINLELRFHPDPCVNLELLIHPDPCVNLELGGSLLLLTASHRFPQQALKIRPY